MSEGREELELRLASVLAGSETSGKGKSASSFIRKPVGSMSEVCLAMVSRVLSSNSSCSILSNS